MPELFDSMFNMRRCFYEQSKQAASEDLEKNLTADIAKIVSSSGDVIGATWKEMIKIRKLRDLFMDYMNRVSGRRC